MMKTVLVAFAALLGVIASPAGGVAWAASPGGAPAHLASTALNLGVETVAAGETLDSLDLAMGQAVVDGTVTGSVTVGLGQAVVGPGGTIAGDLSVGTGEATVSGRVGGVVRVALGSVEIAPAADAGSVAVSGRGRVVVYGTVRGNIDVNYGEVVLAAGSSVQGAIHVVTGRVTREGGQVAGGVTVDREVSEAELSDALGSAGSFGTPSIHVGPLAIRFGPDGEILWSVPSIIAGPASARSHGGSWVWWSFVGRLSWGFAMATALFLVGLLAMVLFPRAEAGMVRGVLERPWRSLATGFLTLVLALPAFILLLVSIVGIPLAVLLPFALVALFFTGEAVVFHTLGQLMRQRFWPGKAWHALAELAAGAVLAFLLLQIPILGGLAAFVAAVIGAGALLLTRFGTWRPWFRSNGSSQPPAPEGGPGPTG